MIELFGEKKITKKYRQGGLIEDFFLEKDKIEKNKFLGLSLSQKKINLLFILFLLSLSLLFAKTVYLQVIKGQHYYSLAEKNRLRLKYIPAKRGIIYDRHNTVLVRNVPNFSLVIIPSDLPKTKKEKEVVIDKLSLIIKREKKEIENKLKNVSFDSPLPLTILENINQEEAILLEIESVNLPGVSLEIGSKRQYGASLYKKNSSLSHLLGYQGKITQKELEQNKDYTLLDYVGKTGLELFYQKELRGRYGKKQIEVDALGKEIKAIAEEKPMAGSDLILTLDLKIQEKLEEILKKYLYLYQKKKAAAIVLNPQNGEILSLISLPDYDNNFFSGKIDSKEYKKLIENPNQPLFNRAISGEYPSGSTMKPIIAAAALEEGIINKNTFFQSLGGIRIDKWFFPDWRAGGHGWVNLTRALAESVNTFFYIIGGGYEKIQGLGLEKIVKYGKLFGLDDSLGIDLPHESRGFLPTREWKEKTKKEAWYIGDTYHLSIGQGDILVTPLQVALFTSVLANQGILYQPRLIKEIISPQKEKRIIKSKILRKGFIQLENINLVRQGLREAVLYGSARSLLNLPFAAAGKTGTAEWQTGKTPHAWFTGFTPYENPQIVITVLVEEGGEGNGISLSVVQEFLSWYFAQKPVNI